jgi:hypothetical protein
MTLRGVMFQLSTLILLWEILMELHSPRQSKRVMKKKKEMIVVKKLQRVS